MEWDFVSKLHSTQLIDDYECWMNYKFCASFKKCVERNNGGLPECDVFDTDKAKERAIKTFLSFNYEDDENIWDVTRWGKEEIGDKYVPFAVDNFGNLICFDVCNNNVVFIDHETCGIEFIAKDFDSFMDVLYE